MYEIKQTPCFILLKKNKTAQKNLVQYFWNIQIMYRHSLGKYNEDTKPKKIQKNTQCTQHAHTKCTII